MTNIKKQTVIWKQYKEIPFIEANQFGEVRTRDHYVRNGKNGSKRLVKGHILKQYLLPCGYLYVILTVNGKTVNLRVHRIVATCFIPNPKNLPEVNHIDCNRTNNAVSNLEWCTSKYNSQYRDKLGHTVNGNPGKPLIVVNLETYEVFWFESQHEAARQLEVRQSDINNVLKRRQKTSHEYWFCYADGNSVENVRVKFGDNIAKKVEELMVEPKEFQKNHNQSCN